jgi:glycosyltransferase involved in cell wall biosynthesis
MDMKEKYGLEPAQQKSATGDAKIPLSVYMITLNNGPTIERALQSVAGWADEVIVVDSYSIDNAGEIIEKYTNTNTLFQYITPSQREKYQFAQNKCKNQWVLFVDADEWLTKEFKEEVERVISSNSASDGYIAYRRNVYLGREIKYGGWYPDREIRLYRKDKGNWQGGIHAKVHVAGKIGTLKSYYMHTPYTDTAHQIRTIDRYAAAFAEDLIQSGKHFHLFNMLLRPPYRFLRDYIFKRGFLDGIPGLIVAVSTTYYVFMKQAKLWEMERLHGKNRNIQE